MDKRIAIILIALGIIAAVASVSIWLLTRDDTTKTETPIANYSKEIKDLPDITQSSLRQSLYGIIKKNNDNIDPSAVTDAFIRQGSDSQEKEKAGQYTGTFIVDIPSLRQSYRISYRYSVQNDGFDSGYPFLATCVSKDELIYGEFDCKNQQYSEEPTDPILQKLPYKGPNYSIISKNNSGIVINIFLNYSENTEKFFRIYKEEALSWLRSQGANLKDYPIEYRDLRNNPVDL